MFEDGRQCIGQFLNVHPSLYTNLPTNCNYVHNCDVASVINEKYNAKRSCCVNILYYPNEKCGKKSAKYMTDLYNYMKLLTI